MPTDRDPSTEASELASFVAETHPALAVATARAAWLAAAGQLAAQAAALEWPAYVVELYRLLGRLRDPHTTLYPIGGLGVRDFVEAWGRCRQDGSSQVSRAPCACESRSARLADRRNRPSAGSALSIRPGSCVHHA